MDALIREWLHLAFRWMHLIAGIMWIGNSLFFMWLDRHIRAVSGKAGVEGELWMVHSGGFYQVEKKLVAPDQLPQVLHWFKWEAGFTWISGFCLLWLVYYMGGGVYLIDPAVSGIGVGAATALCLGLLVAAWAIYDLLMLTPLAHAGSPAAVLWYLLIVAVGYGLCQVISGRAAFLHVGAMMGTIMAANVWMRIIPAQRHLVAATREGRKPDATYAKRAKQRSVHNNYMTFPLLFIMISNHFPQTYGSRHNWLILAGLILAAAGLRHFMNVADRSPMLLLSGIGVAAAVAAVSAGLAPGPAAAPASTPPTAGAIAPVAPEEGGDGRGPTLGGPAGRLADAGRIRGVVRFTGAVPAPKEVTLPGGCAGQDVKPIREQVVQAQEGLLRNAFVWISQGLPDAAGPPPAEDVVIDQRGCIYEPRVIGARVGQRVTFVNSDALLHNVRTVAESNAVFNELMAQKDMRMSKTFSKPEVMVHTKCDIHPWMSAYIGVVPHSYFAVSGDRGQYVLRNVPPGAYTVEAWHEVLGRKQAKVTVPPRATAEIELSFP